MRGYTYPEALKYLLKRDKKILIEIGKLKTKRN